MRIAIIGSGNVATHMAVALHDAGHDIVQVYSRTIGNARLLADTIGSAATDDVDAVICDADVYVFSVKDDALPQLAQSICRRNASAIYLHTAGSVPMSVFEPFAKHNGVLYPMQTFSKSRKVNFREVPCFVEGSDDGTLQKVSQLAASISDSVHELSSERRKSLHLAAVFACNFTNHCYRLCERVLDEAGIDFSLYLPLIDETARKVHELSPGKAQTGPAIRYDETVMNRHIDMLHDDTMKQIYALMSKSIHADC